MLELLVGMIASGKSSYTKAAASAGALIVNDDNIVNACHAGANFLYSYWNKSLYKQIEETIIHYGLSRNISVIVDRPNLSIATRRRYVGLAHSLDQKVKVIIFPMLDRKTHVDRRMAHDNRGRDREYWEKVFDAHLSKYEVPTLDEGIDELVYFEDLYKI